MEVLSADSTDEYLSALKAEKEDIINKMASAASEKASKTQKSKTVALQSQLSPTVRNNPLTCEPKIKVKTRSEQVTGHSVDQASEKNQEEDIGEPGSQSSKQKALVRKRTLDIFRVMFDKGELGGRSVSWDNFVLAMAEVGFDAKYNGGAAVGFEPNEESMWYGIGSIVLHRPHSDPTIDLIMLRTFGKRLSKWFDWSQESFELDVKEKLLYTTMAHVSWNFLCSSDVGSD
jgi:hypothetical protein